MPDIVEIDPHHDAPLREWHTALHAAATAGRTAALVEPYAALAYSLRNAGATKRRLPVAATTDGRVVGALLLELPLRENLDTVSVEIGVPVEHRGRGVATALWQWAERRAADEQRTVFQTEVEVPAGAAADTWPGSLFAARLGFTSQHVEDHLVVPLPYDAAKLAALTNSFPDGGDYRFRSWAGPCPEEHLPTYADLQTAMSRDVPSGQMTREPVELDAERVRTSDRRLAQSYLSLVVLATTQDGEPAGYTQIFVPRSDPEDVLQDDTLVLTAHRGHNLGARLKTANLRQLAAQHGTGRRLHTWTAESNTAMHRVNARFGFQPVGKMHELERVSGGGRMWAAAPGA